jgi:hypothetical protein
MEKDELIKLMTKEQETDNIFSAIEVLDTAAQAHEVRNSEEFDTDNRAIIVAMVMQNLGLDLEDIGQVAEHLVNLGTALEDDEICDDCKETENQIEEWPDQIH